MSRTNHIAPLGLFYLVESAGRAGSFITESDFLPRGKDWTEANAIALLEQSDDAEAIYEVSEGRFRDVSADLAEVWMRKLASDFVPGRDEWPAFVQRHISPLTIEEMESDMAALDRAETLHRRSYSTPA